MRPKKIGVSPEEQRWSRTIVGYVVLPLAVFVATVYVPWYLKISGGIPRIPGTVQRSLVGAAISLIVILTYRHVVADPTYL